MTTMRPVESLALALAVAAFGPMALPGTVLAQQPGTSSAENGDAEGDGPTASPTRLAQAGAAEGEEDDSTDEEEEGEEGEAKETSGRRATGSGSKLKRGDRMEFDTRLIRGERASGAVFLFQRTPRRLPSMVERRRTYLEESVRSLLGGDWAATFSEKRRAEAAGDSDDEETDKKEGDDEGDIIERMASDGDEGQ